MRKEEAAQAAFFFDPKIKFGLLALLPVGWLVPNHYLPWTAAWADGATIAIFLLLGLISLKLRESLFFAPRPALLVFYLLALTWCGVQRLAGVLHFDADFLMVGIYLSLWILAVSSGRSLRGGNGARALALGIVIFSLLSALFAIAQYLSSDFFGEFLVDTPNNWRVYANLAQPNNFSTVCALGICAGNYLFAQKKIGHPTIGVLLFFLVLGIVLSGSRTGIIQMVVLLGACIFWRRIDAARSGILILLFAFSIYLALRVAMPHINEIFLLQDGRSLREQTDPGLRLQMWKMSLRAIYERPWMGYGWQQIGFAQQSVALEFKPHGEHFEHSHNILLDILLWNGVVVGVFLIGILGYVLRDLLRGVNSRELIFPAGVLLILLTHSMLEYPLEYAYFLIPLGLSMGMLDIRPLAKPLVARQWNIGAGFLFSAVLSALLLTVGLEYSRLEERFREIRLSTFGIGVSIEQPEGTSLLRLDQLKRYMNFVLSTARPGMTVAEVDEMRTMAERYGYSPAMLRYALALGLNGQESEAINTLEKICHIHTSERCVQGVEAWENLRKTYPQLPIWENPKMAK